MHKKFTFEYVKEYFKEQNCELLSTNYIGSLKLLKYKCSCNTITKIRFSNFKRGQRCINCSDNAKRLTYNFVKDYFKEQDCELLSTEYINTRTKLDFRCSCKNISIITFNSFKLGHRCTTCGHEKGAKNSYLFRDYIMPSGQIRRIQGYEHFALNELKQKYSEVDIITNRRDIPVIYYESNKNNPKYYPDIFIKSENKIIEVKSMWTYKRNLIKNILKALGARKLGYYFEFWIYDITNKLIIL